MGDVIDYDAAKFDQISRHRDDGLFSLLTAPKYPDMTEKAINCGWWELDEIFKIYPGQFVVVTGIPGHGKSTFLFNYVQQMARENGIRTFMYVPENENNLRHNLRRLWPGNDASFRHYSEFQCFYQSAVIGDWREQPKDLTWILERAAIAIDEAGCQIVLIDPWNELEHCKPKDVLMTDYIRQALMYLKQFARLYQVTVILVTHPTKAVTEHGGRVPTLGDIDGSMNWYNKADHGLVVFRDTAANSTKVISAKVREIGAGRIGTCHFQVDPKTGVFMPMKGGVDL